MWIIQKRLIIRKTQYRSPSPNPTPEPNIIDLKANDTKTYEYDRRKSYEWATRIKKSFVNTLNVELFVSVSLLYISVPDVSLQ